MQNINTNACVASWGTRDKGRGEFYNNYPARRDMTVIEALDQFLRFELGYGGVVRDINEDGDTVTITVVTIVMGCRDTTYFQGTKEDMRPIHEAINFWALACKHDEGTINRATQML